MTTLPSNVYVVLTMGFPVVFINEDDANEYASLSGNELAIRCALRTREDAAELISEFEEEDEGRTRTKTLDPDAFAAAVKAVQDEFPIQVERAENSESVEDHWALRTAIETYLAAHEVERWADDTIQFPRLLAEIRAVGLTERQWDELLASMNLESDDLAELFERAEYEWERLKSQERAR